MQHRDQVTERQDRKEWRSVNTINMINQVSQQNLAEFKACSGIATQQMTREQHEHSDGRTSRVHEQTNLGPEGATETEAVEYSKE